VYTFGFYKIFVYFRLLCTNQPTFHSPRPPTLPTMVQYYCTTIGQYTSPLPTSRLYAIHHTLLVITISCKGQVYICATTRLSMPRGLGLTLNPIGLTLNPIGLTLNPIGLTLNPIGLTLNPIGLTLNPIGLTLNPIGLTLNPIGLTLNPIGLTLNPIGLTLNPIGLRP